MFLSIRLAFVFALAFMALSQVHSVSAANDFIVKVGGNDAYITSTSPNSTHNTNKMWVETDGSSVMIGFIDVTFDENIPSLSDTLCNVRPAQPFMQLTLKINDSGNGTVTLKATNDPQIDERIKWNSPYVPAASTSNPLTATGYVSGSNMLFDITDADFIYSLCDDPYYESIGFRVESTGANAWAFDTWDSQYVNGVGTAPYWYIGFSD